MCKRRIQLQPDFRQEQQIAEYCRKHRIFIHTVLIQIRIVIAELQKRIQIKRRPEILPYINSCIVQKVTRSPAVRRICALDGIAEYRILQRKRTYGKRVQPQRIADKVFRGTQNAHLRQQIRSGNGEVTPGVVRTGVGGGNLSKDFHNLKLAAQRLGRENRMKRTQRVVVHTHRNAHGISVFVPLTDFRTQTDAGIKMILRFVKDNPAFAQVKTPLKIEKIPAFQRRRTFECVFAGRGIGSKRKRIVGL